MLNDGRITCTWSLSLANHVHTRRHTHTHTGYNFFCAESTLRFGVVWLPFAHHITLHHELEFSIHLHMGLGMQPLPHSHRQACARAIMFCCLSSISSFFLRFGWVCKRVRERLHIRYSSRYTQPRTHHNKSQTERNG